MDCKLSDQTPTTWTSHQVKSGFPLKWPNQIQLDQRRVDGWVWISFLSNQSPCKNGTSDCFPLGSSVRMSTTWCDYHAASWMKINAPSLSLPVDVWYNEIRFLSVEVTFGGHLLCGPCPGRAGSLIKTQQKPSVNLQKQKCAECNERTLKRCERGLQAATKQEFGIHKMFSCWAPAITASTVFHQSRTDRANFTVRSDVLEKQVRLSQLVKSTVTAARVSF